MHLFFLACALTGVSEWTKFSTWIVTEKESGAELCTSSKKWHPLLLPCLLAKGRFSWSGWCAPLNPRYTEACVWRSGKSKGHTGGMSVTEMCTPAECELEGGEKQLERDRASAKHVPQWFVGALLMLPVCLIGTARAACSLSCGDLNLQSRGCQPLPGSRFVAQGTAACLCPAAALYQAVHPWSAEGLSSFPLEQRGQGKLHKPVPMAPGIWERSLRAIPHIRASEVCFFLRPSPAKALRAKQGQNRY